MVAVQLQDLTIAVDGKLIPTSAQAPTHGHRILVVLIDTPNKRVNVLDEATVTALGQAVLDAAYIISETQQLSQQHASSSSSDGCASHAAVLPVSAVVFCSAKHGSFCHGADVKMQQEMTDVDAAAVGVRSLSTILANIEQLPVPTVCCINSTALGGGLELALACDHRFASLHHAKQLGLPEVKVGLLPGAGGCVRLPRLIGLGTAMDLMLAGKTVSAPRAKKLGIITDIIDADLTCTTATPHTKQAAGSGGGGDGGGGGGQDDARDAAPGAPAALVAHLHRLLSQNLLPRLGPERKFPRHLTGNTWAEKQFAYAVAVRALDKVAQRRYPAPYRLLNTVLRCWDAGYTDAFAIEQQGYLHLVQTHEAKALMSLFVARSELRRQAGRAFAGDGGAGGDDETQDAGNGASKGAAGAAGAATDRVLVLGSGHMGGGLGQQLHACGAEVIFFDTSEEALTRLRERMVRLYVGSRKRARMPRTEAEAKVAGVFMSTDLSKCLQALTQQDACIRHRVVLECAPEHLAIKTQLLNQVFKHDPTLIFASNTSSIPIRNIAASAEDVTVRDQVIGFHFFHPEANITPVVEIIAHSSIGSATSNAVGRAMVDLAGVMKKVPVVVGDGPGFVLNNMCSTWYQIAGALVVLGGASVQRVETAMTKAGCMSGPFAALDSITLTTAVKVCESMMALVGDKARGSLLLELLRGMLDAGCVGRKATGTSEGFYIWKNGSSVGVNPKVKSIAQAARVRVSDPSSPRVPRLRHFSPQDVTELLLFATINSACDLLDNGIASNARDVDMLAVLAMGMVPQYGGIMAYADTHGPAKIVARLREFKQQLPYLEVSPFLLRVAERGEQRTEEEGAHMFRFRPDIKGTAGPPVGVDHVSRWCPSSVGMADAIVTAGMAAASAALFRLTAKL